MGTRTKIDWCDSTWNPVTGCFHDCPYCYARGIARRFGGKEDHDSHVLETRQYKDGTWNPDPYPFGFAPTLHEYLLHYPLKWKKPRTIFVCSMADLFGNWVPLEWIVKVFDICKAAPQHRYIFLTKNPARYASLIINGILPTEENFWYGSTTETPSDTFWWSDYCNSFVSIEPIMEPFTNIGEQRCYVDWVIVGAETGNRKDKVIPKKEWIMELSENCKKWEVPIFMKESLRSIMGEDFRQEFPWEAK